MGGSPTLRSGSATVPIDDANGTQRDARSADVNRIGVALLLAAPYAVQAAVQMPCALHATLGLDCALCGGTRAVRALARGQLLEATRDNVVVVTAVALLATALLDLARVALFAESGPGWGVRVMRWVDTAPAWMVCVGIASWTAVRNLPGLAFIRPSA
jgi:hypothetical protein